MRSLVPAMKSLTKPGNSYAYRVRNPASMSVVTSLERSNLPLSDLERHLMPSGTIKTSLGLLNRVSEPAMAVMPFAAGLDRVQGFPRPVSLAGAAEQA